MDSARPRRRADPPAAGLRAPPDARSQPADLNRLVAGHGGPDPPHAGAGDRRGDIAGAAICGRSLCDANQLENALLNLCINARDAMPDGGRLTHRDRQHAGSTPPALGPRACRRADTSRSAVTDTGAGMAPEVAARAFEPFFTTKPIGQGTGLGLSMIYGFVRQSGGQVRICTASSGTGTTVCIYLPRHRGGAEARGRPPGQQRPAAPAAGETVLVVEDEPPVRDAGRRGAGRARLPRRCEAARRPPPRCGFCKPTRRIDLLITDVGLPGGMNGRQLADAARAPAARAEGAVHHRLRPQHRRRGGPGGAGHGAAGETVRAGSADPQGAVGPPRLLTVRRPVCQAGPGLAARARLLSAADGSTGGTGVANALGSASGPTATQKHVVAACYLGWTLDAFDFFIMVFVHRRRRGGVRHRPHHRHLGDHADAGHARARRLPVRPAGRPFRPPPDADGRRAGLFGAGIR